MEKVADITTCRKKLSEYGIELENGIRTLRITSRCVPQRGDTESKDPVGHLLYESSRDGRLSHCGLLWALKFYGSLADIDCVSISRWNDKEREEPVCTHHLDSIAAYGDIYEEHKRIDIWNQGVSADIRFGFAAASEVVVDEDNPCFTARDGVLFDKDMTRLIWYPYGKQDETYTVPEGVTEISPWSFGEEMCMIPIRRGDGSFVQAKGQTVTCPIYVTNRNLRQVILPDTVTAIGEYAFYRCKNLKVLSHKELKNYESVGFSAFKDCWFLRILTQEEREACRAELHELKTVRLQEVERKIREAREQGDLSENEAYDAAKTEQQDVKSRIKELEILLEGKWD